MASFKMTQGVSRVPEDVFIEDGMTVTSGGLTVTAGGVTVTAGTTTLGGSFIRDLVTLTATATLTNADHAGRILLMGEVGGDAAATFTLPAATGSGAEFQFIVSVVNTSNYVIKVADATDTIDGSVTLHQDSANTVASFNTAADSDTITMNGTTTGVGALGDYVEVIDIASNQYAVSGMVTCAAGSNPATMFSATVSQLS